MVRPRIANPFHAGSSPVTHSKNLGLHFVRYQKWVISLQTATVHWIYRKACLRATWEITKADLHRLNENGVDRVTTHSGAYEGKWPDPNFGAVVYRLGH